MRRSSASVPARPSARAVSARATKDGAKTARRRTRELLSFASPEGGEAVPPEMTAAAMKKVQLTMYVSKKNFRSDRIIVSVPAGARTSELTEQSEFRQDLRLQCLVMR